MYRRLLNQRAMWQRMFMTAPCNIAGYKGMAGCGVAAATALAWGGSCIAAEETGEGINYPIDLVIGKYPP